MSCDDFVYVDATGRAAGLCGMSAAATATERGGSWVKMRGRKGQGEMPAETIRRVADEDRVRKEAHGNGRVVTASGLPFLSQLDNKHSRGGAVLTGTGHQANHTGKMTARRLSRHHVTLRFSLSDLPWHPNPRALCAAIAGSPSRRDARLCCGRRRAGPARIWHV